MPARLCTCSLIACSLAICLMHQKPNAKAVYRWRLWVVQAALCPKYEFEHGNHCYNLQTAANPITEVREPVIKTPLTLHCTSYKETRYYKK